MEGRQTAAELALLVSAGRPQLSCCPGIRCVRAEKFGKRVQAACQLDSPLCVEVVKCLDCPCGKPSHSSPDVSGVDLLLEQWTISVVPNRSGEAPMTVQGLFQAVRSQLHFSQLSAWRSSSCGLEPRHVSYRLAPPGHQAAFARRPDEHLFPLAKLSRSHALRVCVRSLPRTESIPRAVCGIHHEAVHQESQPSMLSGCGAPEASLRTRKYRSPPPSRTNGPTGIDGRGWNSPPPTPAAQRRGRHATLRRRDARQTVEVVDDRMRNPCNRPGKHRCSCGDEDDLELEPSYSRNSSKLQLSTEELGQVLAVLRDKNAPARSFAQVTNTSSSTKKQFSSRLNSIASTSEECLAHHSSTSGCDKNSVLVNTILISDQQDGSELCEKPPLVPDCVAKHKRSIKLSKSGTHECCNFDSQCDYVQGIKSINLKGIDNTNISIIRENEFSPPVQTSVSTTDLKQVGRFESTDSSDRTTLKLSECLQQNSTARTFEKLTFEDSQLKYVNNVQNCAPVNFSVGVSSRTKAVDSGATKSVQTYFEVPCNNNNKSAEKKSRTKFEYVPKKIDSDFKDISEKGELRQVPSAREKLRFRRSLDSAASLVFHCRTGLPLTSSPAPIRRPSTTSCFDFDSSLNSVSAIRSALFESSEDSQSTSSDDTETPSPVDTVPPTNFREVSRRLRCGASPCSSLLGSFEESVLNGRLEPVSTVQGFTADLGASGSFCPRHVLLPVTVFFYTLGDNDKVSAPYLAHINLGKKGYNVPRSGTVQVTLLNPLGTVVKMFVVMYDLCDMPANSQTFLRQRTLYMPANSGGNLMENAQKWLRYLIHLRFFSSKSGRIYLHTDIRMIIFRKSDEDTATGLGLDMAYELRSFTRGPTNPKFSPRQ